MTGLDGQTALPELLKALPSARSAASGGRDGETPAEARR